MKRDGVDHPKTLRLARELGVPKYAAVGLLECLFNFTARYAPYGNVGKMGDDEIEAFVGWDGSPGALVAALHKCGWLDPHETCRFVVHDWSDHADDSVKKRWRRDSSVSSGHVPDMTGLPSPALPSQAKPCPAPGGADADGLPPAPAAPSAAVWDEWEAWTGKGAAFHLRSVSSLVGEYGDEMVLAAVREARKCGAEPRSPFAYIRHICLRCKDQGVMPGAGPKAAPKPRVVVPPMSLAGVRPLS